MQTNRTPQPAYLVCYQPTEAAPTCQLFTHSKLLTARKAAMSYAEILLADIWLRDDIDAQVSVKLIEQTDQPVTHDVPGIARVFQVHRFSNRFLPAEEAKPILVDALNQLHQEYDYYLSHDYSMGFGFVRAQLQQLGDFQVCCYLQDAAGYFGELMGLYCSAYAESNPPEPTYLAYYEDNHQRIHQLRDARVS